MTLTGTVATAAETAAVRAEIRESELRLRAEIAVVRTEIFELRADILKWGHRHGRLSDRRHPWRRRGAALALALASGKIGAQWLSSALRKNRSAKPPHCKPRFCGRFNAGHWHWFMPAG
jgi:hypothetical protein